jgi:hypothetical protein
MLRRSSATIVRLTVVAILSLIGTATTGFFGMNLLDEAGAPLIAKIIYFTLVAALVIALTVYTVVKASRLADFFEVLADGRLAGAARRWRSSMSGAGASDAGNRGKVIREVIFWSQHGKSNLGGRRV